MVSAPISPNNNYLGSVNESVTFGRNKKPETQKKLTRLSSQAERDLLRHETYHKDAENLRKIFDKNLSYNQLNWIEKKMIDPKTYNRGMDLFFVNLHHDIDYGKLRSFNEAVTAATEAIAKNPSNGERVKRTMFKKIRSLSKKFETDYNDLRQKINSTNTDNYAV